MKIKPSNKLHKKRWLVFFLAISFLFYEFFIRVFPSTMVFSLMEAFSIDASYLGTLSAFYFYAYAPMQLPVGLLMDRFGAKNLLSFAALICAIGSFLFMMSNDIGLAEFGRFFMGIGSAFAFVGMVYVCSHWFPKEKLALLVGLGNSVGMLGAVFGEGPLSLFVGLFGWKLTVAILGIAGVLLAVTIYISINTEGELTNTNAPKKGSLIEALENFKQVICHYQTWLNAFGALLFYLTTGAFAGLWATPFLKNVHNIPSETASFIVSMLFIGWIVGGPVIGHLSDKIHSRKMVLIVSALLCLFLLLPVILIPNLNTSTLFILFTFIGVASSGQLLNFSYAVELHKPEAKGSAIAITNCVIAAGGAVLQPLVGVFLDMGWTGETANNIRIYSIADYQRAVMSFPIAIALSIIVFLFLYRTQKNTPHHTF